MKKTGKRLTAALLAALLLLFAAPLGVFAAGPVPSVAAVDGEHVITNVVWNPGYIGSPYHEGNALKVVKQSWNSAYRYTNPIVIPHAFTTLTWSESTVKGSASQNATVVSSWKVENGEYVLDFTGTLIAGDGKNTRGIQSYNETAQTITYTYTTTRDNECLRFGCYGGLTSGFAANSAECPRIYAYEASLAEGTVGGVAWFSGYVGSASHATYQSELAALQPSYNYTMPVRVPHAGTTVSFTDTASPFASAAAYAVFVWRVGDNGQLEICYGIDGERDLPFVGTAGSSRTYTYTTSADGEILRFCYRSEAAMGTVPVSVPQIHYEEESAAARTLTAAGYDPARAADVERYVAWSSGAVGSTASASHVNSIYADAAYRLSSVIPIYGAGTTVTFTDTEAPFTENDVYAISRFVGGGFNGSNSDSIDTVIGGVTGATYRENADGSRTYTYTTTQDAEYLRVCVRGTETADPVVYSTIPGGNPDHHALLDGLTAYFIGDSYFEGNGVVRESLWITRLTGRYGMCFANRGRNGSTVSAYVDTNNPMTARYTVFPAATPDLIVFEGGRNDYNKSVPIGKFTDHTDATFCGAVNIILDGYRAKYPNALILCVTPWDLDGLSGLSSNETNGAGAQTQDYAETFAKLAEMRNDYHIRVIKNYDKTVIPVLMKKSEFRAVCCQTANDISHLNARGQAFAFRYYDNIIADAYAAFLEAKETPEPLPGEGNTEEHDTPAEPYIEEPFEKENGWLLPVVIGGAVAVAVALTVTFILIGKRKKK